MQGRAGLVPKLSAGAARCERHIADDGDKAFGDFNPVQLAAASVTIFLCTRNGAMFLEEQLASVVRQSHPYWRIIVSDDGSTDATRAILGSLLEFGEGKRGIEIRNGPEQGATANFLSLATDPSIDGAFFAYCDQDDVWYPEKLERALSWLSSVSTDVPALYSSRTSLIDAEGRSIGFSQLFRKAPDFRNALVQSLAGANTMVFNAAARGLLIAAGVCDAVAHDWWTYMLVSGAGGTIYYDPIPTLAYRQHKTNEIGSNAGLSATIWRLAKFLRGEWTNWNDRNTSALARCGFLLTPENRAILATFDILRRSSLFERLHAWRRIGLFRQTIVGQLGLLFAIIFRKI